MKKRYFLGQKLEDIIQQVIIDFGDLGIELDQQLYFFDYSLEYLRDGTQEYVVRFDEKNIKLPSEFVLPCKTPDKDELLGKIFVEEVLVSVIDDLTDEDVAPLGFENKQDFITRMSKAYKYQLQPYNFISIYKLGAFKEEKD